MNRCTRCGESKPASMFSRNRQRKSGLFAWCKPCAAAQRKAALVVDPAARARKVASQKEWRARNRERIRAYRARTRDVMNARARAYRARRVLTPEQREARLAYGRAWRAANRERIAAYKRDYWARERDAQSTAARRLAAALGIRSRPAITGSARVVVAA